jgi:hypothetical protein
MKKMFLLAMAGLLAAGSVAYASGDPVPCKKSTKKVCTPPCKEKCTKESKGCCAKVK